MNIEDFVPAAEPLEMDQRLAMRGELFSTIRHEQEGLATQKGRGRSSFWPTWTRQRVAAVAGALVVALGLVVFAGILSGGGGRPAAASDLDMAAANLNAQSRGVAASGSLGLDDLPPGKYEYVVEETAALVVSDRGSGHQASIYLAPQTEETWRRADGSGVQRLTPLPPVFDSSADRQGADIQPAEKRPVVQALPASVGLVDASWGYMMGLPTDPYALRARLRADANAPLDDQRTFQLVLDLLNAGPPPAVQAALFKVASMIVGVESRPSTVDALGRSASVAALTHDAQRDEMLFDPRTGAYLGSLTIESSTGRVQGYTLVRSISEASTAPMDHASLPTDAPVESPGATERPPTSGTRD